MKQLLKEYKNYIKLLGEELDETVPIAHAHGWRSTRYDRGKQIRENIEKLGSKCLN